MCTTAKPESVFARRACVMSDGSFSPISCVGSLPLWRLSLGISGITETLRQSVVPIPRDVDVSHAPRRTFAQRDGLKP
jgi:hypothetical protein